MEANKILFITDKYLPFPSSNGACVSKIVKSYKEGKNVYILAFSSDESENTSSNEFYCHYIRQPSSAFNRMFGYCQDDSAVNELFLTACQIIEENKIDIVICVYRPVESLLAGLKLKKKYHDLCVIGYFLDNMCEWTSSSKLKDKIFFVNQKRLLRHINRAFNSSIVLRYYKNTFEKALSKVNKVSYVGLPSLKEHHRKETKPVFESDNINIVYAGSFYQSCRRPDQILEFLREVCDVLPQIKIHLYSWGCEDLVNAAKQKMGQSLVVHGRVSADEAERAIQNADVLLNIGNDMPYAVPGKLFEYFSTGKSIINFCYHRNDGAAEDCEKYGNIFNVYDKFANSVADCADFISNRCTLPWDAVRTIFYDSLPEYTTDKIMKIRQEDKNV